MIPVVFSCDHNYIMPVGVAIQSMLECSHDVDIDLFILQSESVTDEDRKMLKSVTERFDTKISFIPMGKTFDHGYEIRGITYATYYRLLIPWLIQQYDKVIYCDGDVVFCDSIKSLFDIDLGNNYIAAMRPYKYNKTSFKYYAPRLGLFPQDYFQAGVIVINSRLWREDDLKINFEKEVGKKYKMVDQDILNIVCKDKIVDLPMRFNVFPDLYRDLMNQTDDDKITPNIIHFAGKKPWDTITYGWYKWWNVYCRSPFYDSYREISIINKTCNPSNKVAITKLIKKNFPGLYKLKTIIMAKYF